VEEAVRSHFAARQPAASRMDGGVGQGGDAE
jgi:hypothetical protein